MSPWQNFALGFTYLSPVVGVYSVFAIALAAAGPPMFWWLPIAGLGQLLVALVFCEAVSQYPIAGGAYQWARRLAGPRWGWITAWMYVWALIASVASVAFGSGPFIASFLGMEPSRIWAVGLAIALILAAGATNLLGTRVLARVAFFGFAAELIGAIFVGVWLLTTSRNHGLDVFFDRFNAPSSGSYTTALIVAALIGLTQFYGFEACGNVAEEVKAPERIIPIAMRRTIYIGGAAATFVCAALILAVVDIPAVISGADTNPISRVLEDAFGPILSRVVTGVVLISFFSCVLSLQAAASRTVFSLARDKAVPFADRLGRLTTHGRAPVAALVSVGIAIPVLFELVDFFIGGGIAQITAFAALGIYIAFSMVVMASIYARLKGWRPAGSFRLGKWGWPVLMGALVWEVFAVVALCWPAGDFAQPATWAALVGGAIVLSTGVAYLLIGRPDRRQLTDVA